METFVWKEKFSVHVDEMDRQHKKLLEYFAEIRKELMSGKSGDSVAMLLGELAEYLDFHFAEEERLMRSMNYPELDSQINMHAALSNELKEVTGQLKLGTIPSQSVIALLRDWYINHIQFEDRKYGELINRGKPLA